MKTLPGLWPLIRPHTGEVADVQPTEHGHGSDLTAVVDCQSGPFFVKAIRNRPGGRRESLHREQAINPFMHPVSPAVRWCAENDEWIVLGFDVFHGRPAELTPDSPDLPTVTEVLTRIEDLDLPEVARDWHETRWDQFATDQEEAQLFRGDALLYTDINPGNFVIGARGAWVVDWSWPTRGAGFITPASLVVELVASDHTPASAEFWAARCPAWNSAAPEAIDAFAAANVRLSWTAAWRRPELPWRRALAEAAESWAWHRGLTVT